MLKKYKNEIFAVVQSAGYDPDNFGWADDANSSWVTSKLTVKNSGLWFLFLNPVENYGTFRYQYTSFNPQYSASGTFPRDKFLNFDDIKKDFLLWLNSQYKEFYEEQTGIDIWAEYKKGNKTLNLYQIDFDDKSPFSIDEKIQIKNSINDLKYLIQKNLNTNEQEQKLVNARLDYLIEASDRLNKFDWKSVAINTIISISITLSLDTEKGKFLFELFKKVFGAIQHVIPTLQP
jgi:hypothetical protein